MIGHWPRRALARLVVATLLATAVVGGATATPRAAAAAPSAWTGGVDLYRAGVFTTQQTWSWCTAAGVQITRNIALGQADHSKAAQQRYFDYMRAHDHYAIPLSDGTDPAGWTAGLRRFVDDRYRLVASRTFDAALRSAVTNLRLTNLPVSLAVQHGNHAWLLTGFTATADPAVTTRFTVTSVRVVGPLWGLQNASYGYDMRPDTKLTPRQLAGFFAPWHYARIRMSFEGQWVSIQPVAAKATAPAPKASALPSGMATRSPSPSVGPSSAAPASLVSDPTGSGAAAASTSIAGVASTASPTPIALDAAAASTEAPRTWSVLLLVLGLGVGSVVVLVVAVARPGTRAGRRRRP